MATLNFKTNIQLKSIIGKDLINDDNIAILELVKNSFDADAKKVEVQYLNLKDNDDKTIEIFSNKTSRLLIKDDGQGMNLVDIQNKWLNIAYSEKKSNNRQHNRMMAGAKGVGRFSCDRLGEYLNLYAKKKNSNEYFLLKIDWNKFEVEDDKQEIQSINLEYENLSAKDLKDRNIPAFNQGVLLEIIKLRSNWIYEIKDNKGKRIGWNTDKLVNLKKYLEKLINPNQAFEKNDFGIYLDAPEFIEENEQKEEQEKFIGKIENTIFDKLDFKATSIESKIIEDGQVIFTELKDKGQTIFWIKEKNEFAPEIKDVKIILYYLNPYTKAFFTKQMGIRSVEYGSIYVFLNGFRIPPYGEYGDDWLYLEQRKGQGYARFLSQRELVGRIEILDNANSFKVISSREGIEKNESYRKLTDQKNGYFFKTFKRLEKYVVDGLEWDSIPEEDRNKISEIEKKIISGETKEADLIYREDDLTKKRRVYETIHSIISAKGDNVIELYINEDLILNKIIEEKESSEREFEQLLLDFENKKIDGDILARILQKKAEQNKGLEKQLSEFSKYTTNDVTTKALLELKYYKETSERQEQIIKDLISKLTNLNTEKELSEKELATLRKEVQQARSKAKEAEEKAAKTEQVLKHTIGQNSFLKDSVKADTKELQSLLHHTEKATYWINKHLENLIKGIEKGDSKEKLFESISSISLENQKIFSFTKYHKSTQFNTFVKTINQDVVSFTNEYINNVCKFYEDYEGMNIQIKNPSGITFKREFAPIEIPIIIDNLLNNSKKAKAKNVVFEWLENSAKEIVLHVTDNGTGIEKSIVDNIFDFRFTTTKGSGLGLYHVKTVLNKMRGDIVANPKHTKGAEFIITIKK